MAAPLLLDVWEMCCKKAGTGKDTLQMSFLKKKTEFGKKVKQTGPCYSYCIKFDP